MTNFPENMDEIIKAIEKYNDDAVVLKKEHEEEKDYIKDEKEINIENEEELFKEIDRLVEEATTKYHETVSNRISDIFFLSHNVDIIDLNGDECRGYTGSGFDGVSYYIYKGSTLDLKIIVDNDDLIVDYILEINDSSKKIEFHIYFEV